VNTVTPATQPAAITLCQLPCGLRVTVATLPAIEGLIPRQLPDFWWSATTRPNESVPIPDPLSPGVRGRRDFSNSSATDFSRDAILLGAKVFMTRFSADLQLSYTGCNTMTTSALQPSHVADSRNSCVSTDVSESRQISLPADSFRTPNPESLSESGVLLQNLEETLSGFAADVRFRE